MYVFICLCIRFRINFSSVQFSGWPGRTPWLVLQGASHIGVTVYLSVDCFIYLFMFGMFFIFFIYYYYYIFIFMFFLFVYLLLCSFCLELCVLTF